MQQPATYSNTVPNAPYQPQAAQQHLPGQVLNRLTYFVVTIVIVVLVGGSLFWLQWAAQRGITLGYPTPHVVLSSSGTSAQIMNALQFTANSTGRDVTYSWNFGDQVYASGASVTHSYQSSGSYTVTVTATDSIGQTSTASQTITIIAPPPQASFTYYNNGNASITFDASASTADPSTSIQSYNWSFGDGGTQVTSYSQYTYTYSNYGQYTVTLVVTDANGQNSQPFTETISV